MAQQAAPPFEIIFERRLVPGTDGCQEEQHLTLSLREPLLTALREIDAMTLKVFVALALSVHPLGGPEFQELCTLGIVQPEDEGRLAAVLTAIELGTLVKADRRTVDCHGELLAARGWVTSRDLPSKNAQGRFSGGRVYLLKGKILYTSKDALDEKQPPCTSNVHGEAMEGEDGATVYSECTRSQQPMYTAPALDVHGDAPMVMETIQGKGKETTTSPSAVVSVDPSLSNSLEEKTTPASRQQQVLANVRTVLTHFVDRVSERWPDPIDQPGAPPSRAAARYEVAYPLLSTEVPAATVAQAPAEMIEELWILSQALRGQGPVELAQTIDRVLAGDVPSPPQRLAYFWPVFPGAKRLHRELKRDLQSGRALPGGQQYRETRKLFLLLNRLNVGLPLLEQLRGLIERAGVVPVQRALQKAADLDRSYVTISFLERGLVQARQEEAPAGGEAVDDDAGPVVEERSARELHLVRVWLDDYGICEPALTELGRITPLTRVRSWILYLDRQDKLTPEQRRAMLVARLRHEEGPPRRWLRIAQAFPPVGPIEDALLEDGYEERRYDGEWSEATLEMFDRELAEAWFKARRLLDR